MLRSAGSVYYSNASFDTASFRAVIHELVEDEAHDEQVVAFLPFFVYRSGQVFSIARKVMDR